MDTKSLIIHISTKLFQRKGYIGVGLNEIIRVCNISKGSFYHHFPNGKEELLIACLSYLKEAITLDMKEIFNSYPTTKVATKIMLEKLINHYDKEGTITSYTFSSIVSEMAIVSDNVRHSFAEIYQQMQDIYFSKLLSDGYSQEEAYSIALMMTASIEGATMLCMTKNTSEPLKVISEMLPNMVKD